MKKLILISIIIFISALSCRINDRLSYWDNVIVNSVPPELKKIRVIRKSDIKDKDNLDAFEQNNPDIIIRDDFNNNGKEDIVIPCLSQTKNNIWYILIFERDQARYKLIKYFEFNLSSIYVFKTKGKKFKLIRVGQSYASDYSNYIFWKNSNYILQ